MDSLISINVRWQLVFMMFASLLLSACSSSSGEYQFETLDGKTTIGATHQTKYISSAQRAKTSIHIDAASKKIRTPVDILILFDRTGSMRDVIKTTANASTDIVKEIQANVPDTRFAVATVADYSPLFTNSADKRTWLLNADFTFNATDIEKAAHAINLTDGGDLPEAYSRGFYEAADLAWRQQAKKIIIFFGDSIDHPIDPGRDEKLGTDDDLSMEQVLAKLKAKKITVVGIHTKNDPLVVNQFNMISTNTGGKAVSLKDASSSSKVIIASIKDAITKPATLIAQGKQSAWVTAQPTTPTKKNRTTYSIDINVPKGTPAGVYLIPLKFYSAIPGDALVTALKNKPIEIKVITGWYNHPLVIWLPFILLVAYLIWSSISMLSGGYKRAISVTSKHKYDTNHYSLSYLILDILALTALVCTMVAVYLCVNNLVLSELLSTLGTLVR